MDGLERVKALGRQISIFMSHEDEVRFFEEINRSGDFFVVDGRLVEGRPQRLCLPGESTQVFIISHRSEVSAVGEYFDTGECIELNRSMPAKGKKLVEGRLYVETTKLKNGELVPVPEWLVEYYEYLVKWIKKHAHRSSATRYSYAMEGAYRLYFEEGWALTTTTPLEPVDFGPRINWHVGTMHILDVIVNDPSPERLWRVVHCSGSTAWIERESVRKIQRDAEVEYVSKDSLIRIDLDSGKTECNTVDGELCDITFSDDYVYGILKLNEDDSPRVLARIHQTTKKNEILWRFGPEDKFVTLWDVLQDEYILIRVWSGKEEDDEHVELLSLSDHKRINLFADGLPYFIHSKEGIGVLIDFEIDPADKMEALDSGSDTRIWSDRIILLDPFSKTSSATKVVIDDPSPERLWKVVHCSGTTVWIKRTSVQKTRRRSKTKSVKKDTLIEMDLDSKKQTELEIEGELASVKFAGDFVYVVVKPNEGDYPYILARIHRNTKAMELLWHFGPDDGAIELIDVFQDEYVLIDVWCEREHDGRTDLLRLSDHIRRNISELNKTTLRVPRPYFVHSREGLRILIDSAVDPADKMVAMEADSDPDVWADRIVLVDPYG